MPKRNKGTMSNVDFMFQQAQKDLSAATYCRYCGIDINQPSRKQSETNWRQDLDWEMKYKAHVTCHREHTLKERGIIRR